MLHYSAVQVGFVEAVQNVVPLFFIVATKFNHCYQSLYSFYSYIHIFYF